MPGRCEVSMRSIAPQNVGPLAGSSGNVESSVWVKKKMRRTTGWWVFPMGFSPESCCNPGKILFLGGRQRWISNFWTLIQNPKKTNDSVDDFQELGRRAEKAWTSQIWSLTVYYGESQRFRAKSYLELLLVHQQYPNHHFLQVLPLGSDWHGECHVCHSCQTVCRCWPVFWTLLNNL